MTTDTKQLMENVAAVHSFLETFKDKEYGPLKEDVERLSAQITESARASKRAALLRQVESTTRGARVASGKYRGFDEFDLMISNEVLCLAKSGGTDGNWPGLLRRDRLRRSGLGASDRSTGHLGVCLIDWWAS